MKASKRPGTAPQMGNEVQLARIRLARAETQLASSKEQARLAKRRRKEAKEAARRAKKQARLAKEEVAQAKLALAEAEERLAQATQRPPAASVRKKEAKSAASPRAKARTMSVRGQTNPKAQRIEHSGTQPAPAAERNAPGSAPGDIELASAESKPSEAIDYPPPTETPAAEE